jgi:4a-hydroxytetrahydrobiopterin dehydratase
MIEELSEPRREELLRELTAWRYDPARKAIHRRIRRRDFGDALAAMVRIGLVADKLDHHPEWSNVDDVLDIWLTTHDAGGLSERDIELARRIDDIVDEP